MNDRGSPDAKPLAVRTRRTVGPGRRLSEALVDCPRRVTMIPASECVECEDCIGLERGPDGVRLRCAVHRDESAGTLAAEQDNLSAAAVRTPLSDIMTGDVLCVFPDLRVEHLIDLLVESNVSGAPVVDDGGRPIGIVSKSDLVRGFAAGTTVADIMMPLAFTLPETASLSRAAALMAFEGIHRIPVVSSKGRVIGIVSALDITRWLAKLDRRASRRRAIERPGAGPQP